MFSVVTACSLSLVVDFLRVSHVSADYICIWRRPRLRSKMNPEGLFFSGIHQIIAASSQTIRLHEDSSPRVLLRPLLSQRWFIAECKRDRSGSAVIADGPRAGRGTAAM